MKNITRKNGIYYHKLFLFGFFIFIFCSALPVDKGFAQQKEVKIRAHLNGEKLTIEANGKKFEGRCITEITCLRWGCSNVHDAQGASCSYDSYNGIVNCSFKPSYGCGCKTTASRGVTLNYSNGCRYSSDTSYKPSWACSDCRWGDTKTWTATPQCMEYKKCSDWEFDSADILSLMPDIGLATIDVNLIEY